MTSLLSTQQEQPVPQRTTFNGSGNQPLSLQTPSHLSPLHEQHHSHFATISLLFTSFMEAIDIQI